MFSRRIISTVSMMLCATALLCAEGVTPGGRYEVKQLQKRDTILIADQLQYSVEIEDVEAGDRILLPEPGPYFNDTLVLVRGWQVDTVGFRKVGKIRHPRIRASLTVAPFEEGTWQMPAIPMLRERGEMSDTLVFGAPEIEVTTIQIDTATFEIHDIKGQMRYPLTLREMLPYIAVIWLLALVFTIVWCLVKMRRRRDQETVSHDPAYIVALRELDKYRGEKYWAPERQKTMYSGITDALRTYIEKRFDINAEEMTTAEIFDALKGSEDITPDLYNETKELFELSDFVKFAKHTASEQDNQHAVPVAVSFVMGTYQSQMDEQAAQEGGEEK